MPGLNGGKRRSLLPHAVKEIADWLTEEFIFVMRSVRAADRWRVSGQLCQLLVTVSRHGPRMPQIRCSPSQDHRQQSLLSSSLPHSVLSFFYIFPLSSIGLFLISVKKSCDLTFVKYFKVYHPKIMGICKSCYSKIKGDYRRHYLERVLLENNECAQWKEGR